MANIKDLIKSIEAADSSFDEKLAAINQMEETLVAIRQQEEQAVQDNVDLIVEAIKVMERKVESQLEIAKSIVPEKGDKGDKGERGLDGANGRDGKDGRDGINGSDGQDGKDGVSVSDAKIDFDGSLIITLSTGQEINVGEVVAPELQEKIKLVTSGGAGTVLPNQAGNSGKVLGTDGSTLSWVTGGGGSGTVTSVAATAGTGISVTGSPITSSGTLNITNTAPDQTVALTGAGTTAVTGTYPNFTITSNDAYVGTVTSVGGTGTVNGLTLTGTVTSSGSLTLGGTLDLSSPPAIGGTTPAAISATTLSLTGTTNQVSSVAVTSVPSAPSAGNLNTFARTIAGGYTAPAFLNATQAVAMLQPAIANKRISTFTPQTGAVISLIGFVAGSVQGTATAAAPSSTSFFTRAPRVTYVSAGTAGSFASWYQGVGTVTLGVSGTPNFGGFYYVTRFGIADTVASPRTFIGLASVGTTPTNVEPSTLVNSIGIGQGASNTNLFVYYGGSAAQTPINLGANFPTNTSNTDWYELTLFAPPTSNNTVYYQVVRLNTGNVASGTLTGTAGTVLPANTTFLMPRNWRTNNATASAVTLAFGNMYLEMDY
jgi:hypothetical protein